MELIYDCATENRASQAKYGKVWKALVSCTEMVLASGRGVIIEKVSILQQCIIFMSLRCPTSITKERKTQRWYILSVCTAPVDHASKREVGVRHRGVAPLQELYTRVGFCIQRKKVNHSAVRYHPDGEPQVLSRNAFSLHEKKSTASDKLVFFARLELLPKLNSPPRGRTL